MIGSHLLRHAPKGNGFVPQNSRLKHVEEANLTFGEVPSDRLGDLLESALLTAHAALA